MIRVVALRKAAVAGAAGAVAWEAALRGFSLAGLPLFDIVRSLGTLVFRADAPLAWWPVGLAAHMLVGVCWALVYAYFFWGRFDWPPPLQGLAFSALPAALALLIVSPQLRLMQMGERQVRLTAELIGPSLGAREIAGLLLGHVIFGLTVGALYTRPVGYRADRPPRLESRPASRRGRKPKRRRQDGDGFIFATGIECSYPTIEGGRWRRDQLDSTRHYERWSDDFELAREIGVTHLRYGPPLHLLFRGPGQYDWALVDEPMAELRDHGPEPIVDLCHFGVPAWLGDFQNPDVARALGEYAGAFAGRYPWVRFYTPVNEIYVSARMSALDGAWNEQRSDETAFVTAAFNLAGASVAMTDAILLARPDALFVNSESSEFAQPCCPDPEIRAIAEFENERRFLPLDLIYAHEVGERMLGYLREHGVEPDYRQFLQREVPRRTVLGLDYYEWNERLIDNDGRPRALGELFGWYVIASQYHERYRRPMMHTETNRLDASDGPRWLWRQWHNVQLLRGAGVPLVGFTWYSLTDQVDWDIALAQALGKVNPVGLFDLNRDVRPVGLSYKHLIEMHRDQPEYRHCPALAELLG
ncbi:MAG TPA: family 1 glycosylhydrolase [Sphingomicrobium sp.]|nr:family 1 glycosylhydrolase [Sphingomicrobium sp.]